MALAQKLLKANVADSAGGQIVTYRGLRRTTGRMNPADRLWVYSRGGQPCRRCGTRIAICKDGDDARVTYSLAPPAGAGVKDTEPVVGRVVHRRLHPFTGPGWEQGAIVIAPFFLYTAPFFITNWDVAERIHVIEGIAGHRDEIPRSCPP